jgi:hypothetical protein
VGRDGEQSQTARDPTLSEGVSIFHERAQMSEKPMKRIPHPDDFMVVTLSLGFRAKVSPSVEDPPSLDVIEFRCTLPKEEAAEYLESVVDAIRAKRLYGFMVQASAESIVGAGDWIEKTIDDIIAEAQTENDR